MSKKSVLSWLRRKMTLLVFGSQWYDLTEKNQELVIRDLLRAVLVVLLAILCWVLYYNGWLS